MTENFPGDTVMLETSFAVSGSTEASERLPMADVPLLDRLNSSSFDVRRRLQSPDRRPAQMQANLPTRRRVRFHSDGSACFQPSFFCSKATNRCRSAVALMHILMVLLERPGELVTRQELMARVWPNLFVEPATLTVHISALRRALRDGRDGNRFIINIRGRGYCFVSANQVAAAKIVR